LQGCTQISKDLISLRRKVVPSDQLAIAIKGGLAGYEDYAAGAHVNDLRIAWRGAKLGRIDAPNGPCLAINHEASSLLGAITVRAMTSL
jgi:hypothetical protein